MHSVKIYSGWCSKAEFDSSVASFQPALFRTAISDTNINCIVNHTSDNLVDVSISNSDGAYLGHPTERACIEMPYSEFMHSFATKETLAHLFLSQCSLLNTSSGPLQIDLSEEVLHWLPPFLCAADIDQANLWANIAPACTSLHYDAYHNILRVLQGSKIVRLLSPAMTARLNPHCAFAEAPNHSTASWNSLDEYFTQATTDDGCCEVMLVAGDALFIPEGWWHTVQSTERTMAVNFWFEHRPLHALLSEEHMLPYFLRSMAYSMITDEQEAESNNEQQERIDKQEIVQEEQDHKRARITSNHGDKIDMLLLLETILQTTVRDPLIDELVSQSSNLDLFQQTWLPTAKKSPVEMQSVIMLFTPQQASRLLFHWDHINEEYPVESKGVFREFYSCFGGDHVEVIYKHLMILQGQYRKQVGREQLSLILGVT